MTMMTFSRRRAIAVTCGGVLALQGFRAAALSTTEAESFVTGVIEELRKLINDGRDGAEGAAEFLALLERKSSLEAVGKFAIGRTWRDMSAPQQAAYQEAFRGYISRTYQNRFNEYNGEDIIVVGAIDAGAKGVLVKSRLTRPSAKPVEVEWLVSDRSGAPLLSDVVFEGVSLAITLRETFGGMLEKRKGDIDAFIKDLGASSGA